MDFIFIDFLGKSVWIWLLFISLVSTLLFLDLGVLHSKAKTISIKESLIMSGFYIGIAIVFGFWIMYQMGNDLALQYFTGFAVEKALAMDNVFVIGMIFTYFAIPTHLQHRVLFWGILGVIVLRAIMIGLGSALISEFSWVLYIFGALLIFTGIKMLILADHSPNIENNPIIRFVQKRFNVTKELHGEKFLVRLPDSNGKMKTFLTPLMLALILIEIVDVIFAVDSVPAIFAITTDPFIVYTSNIFAILGLRALYFALSAMVHRFKYLKYALSVVLIFVGFKIFYSQIFEKMDPLISLSITLAILSSGVFYSLWKTRPQSNIK